MYKKFNFISGLPRSGSTLLSSILKQNPKFSTSITDPLFDYCQSIIRETNVSAGMRKIVSEEKVKTVIKGIFESFYENPDMVYFNTNRSWSSNTPLLKDLFPDFKMIVCVREVPWILDSFESLNSKNPYTLKSIYHHQELKSVYERTYMLMGNIPNYTGYVHSPLNMLKQSIFSNENQNICYVEYETLVSDPISTLKKIYYFLEEDWYNHDFENIEDSYPEFDNAVGISGLHNVRKVIGFDQRKPILPIDLWNQFNDETFWKFEEFQVVKDQLNWI